MTMNAKEKKTVNGWLMNGKRTVSGVNEKEGHVLVSIFIHPMLNTTYPTTIHSHISNAKFQRPTFTPLLLIQHV